MNGGEVIPPDGTDDGWHVLALSNGTEVSMCWNPDKRLWDDWNYHVVSAAKASDLGWTYKGPVK